MFTPPPLDKGSTNFPRFTELPPNMSPPPLDDFSPDKEFSPPPMEDFSPPQFEDLSPDRDDECEDYYNLYNGSLELEGEDVKFEKTILQLPPREIMELKLESERCSNFLLNPLIAQTEMEIGSSFGNKEESCSAPDKMEVKKNCSAPIRFEVVQNCVTPNGLEVEDNSSSLDGMDVVEKDSKLVNGVSPSLVFEEKINVERVEEVNALDVPENSLQSEDEDDSDVLPSSGALTAGGGEEQSHIGAVRSSVEEIPVQIQSDENIESVPCDEKEFSKRENVENELCFEPQSEPLEDPPRSRSDSLDRDNWVTSSQSDQLDNNSNKVDTASGDNNNLPLSDISQVKSVISTEEGIETVEDEVLDQLENDEVSIHDKQIELEAVASCTADFENENHGFFADFGEVGGKYEPSESWGNFDEDVIKEDAKGESEDDFGDFDSPSAEDAPASAGLSTILKKIEADITEELSSIFSYLKDSEPGLDTGVSEEIGLCPGGKQEEDQGAMPLLTRLVHQDGLVWKQIEDPACTPSLEFSWAESYLYSTLLSTLNIDTRVMLNGETWKNSIPRNQKPSGPTSEILQPSILQPSILQPHILQSGLLEQTKPSEASGNSDGGSRMQPVEDVPLIQANLHSPDFDWSLPGEPCSEETVPTEPAVVDKSTLFPGGARDKSPGSRNRSPGGLSAGTQTLVDAFPLLNFMHSPVLTFPTRFPMRRTK